MQYDNDFIEKKLRRWEKYLNEYRLPAWEDIPDLGLYMEQVLALLTNYLDYLPPELKDEQFITAATINNYVRNRYMPKPRKKKYYRLHIAYLVMICTLKQSLTIATLTQMIPNDIPEERVKEIYTAYRTRHRIAAEYFVDQVRVIASPILHHEERRTAASVSETSDLISTYAILSGLSGLLAEKLLLLGSAAEKPEEKPEQKAEAEKANE
ncbi:MAG: DUF1836 domain-containing protein [Clostridiales bacterium]|nr:DUF1836 domain-containing protein [Clostridiales bacterium]